MSPIIVASLIFAFLALLLAVSLWSGDDEFTRDCTSAGNGESHDEYHARRR